jgi:tetratricopeptide (TPR) repeat protein
MRKTLLTTLLSAALSVSLLGLSTAQDQPSGTTNPSLEIQRTTRSTPPVQLTATDGTGLQLAGYKAKVVVQGPLAFTELHLTFNNPQERVLEGRFEITLPESAALSRLAMKNANGWQEAEVVELQQARRAYEDFLHRRQDPALLEKQAGNQFQARVFPIPAKGQKELIISYSQELSAKQDYRLPVAGLPKVDEMSIEASAWNGTGSPTKLAYSLHGESPQGDFVIRHCPVPQGLVSGDEVLLSVSIPDATNPTKAVQGNQDLLLMVDTSASRTPGYQAQVTAVKAVVKRWQQNHPKAKISLVAFDQDVTPLNGIGDLQKRRPLGSTNLNQALAWAARQQGYQRLMVVTDGITTAGSEKLTGLLNKSGFQRFDCLVMGGIRDSQSLESIVHHGLPQGGLVLDGDGAMDELLPKLEKPSVSGLKVSVSDASWVWPSTLDGVAPGENRIVYARLNHPSQTAQVSVGGTTSSVALNSVSGPLLHRSAVAANLHRLTPQWREAKGTKKQELAQHMLELSIGNRVLCDLTGLLVLETDADYARFKIDRNALKDILVVTPEGVGLEHRQDAVINHPPPRPVDTKIQARAAEKSAGVLASGDSPQEDRAKDASQKPAGPDDQVSTQTPAKAAESSVPASPPIPPPAISSPEPVPSTTVSERLRQVNRPEPLRRLPTRDTNTETPVNHQEVANDEGDQDQEEKGAPPLTGKFAQIDSQIRNGHNQAALTEATQWQSKQPGDVLALVALGNSYKACHHSKEAARAFGSIIDLYPGRADLRRYAGCLLETVAEGKGLAWDSFAKAVSQRPDHPSGHRLKAYALVRAGRLWDAFESLETAYAIDFPEGRFAGVKEILADDLGIVAAAIVAKNPDHRARVLQRLKKLGVPLAEKPSTRFVLSWETDANDVDFHIRDSKGGHAYYSSMDLASGGRLYADVTTGYGPECFAIPGIPTAFPYKISIHYYSRGPMGYGMGKVEILRHNGKGGLRFEQRPFVVMNDQAFVDLGQVKAD